MNYLASATCKALALLFATGAMADCYNRDHLTAFLTHEYEMRLMSWGMTQDGNMLELFWADSGHFATVLTTPAGCVTVTMPEHLHERLRQPPQRNRAIAPGPLDRGEPT